MLDFSVEMKNEDTCEIRVESFDSEDKRATFIEHLPSHITWHIFENMNLFPVEVELVLR